VTAAARRGTGRRRPRFSAMLRARPSYLALTSIGVAAAAIIGVQLGQSAISEINPVHFQGALTVQGITPPPEPVPFDSYGQPYVWSLNPPPLSVDCAPDCDGGRARQAMRLALDDSAGRDAALPYWRDATPATELQPWTPGTVSNGGTFERYMHYPVDREQAEHPMPRPAAAEAPPPPTPAEALRIPPAPPAAEPALAKPIVQE
jgi:hypothetical protein